MSHPSLKWPKTWKKNHGYKIHGSVIRMMVLSSKCPAIFAPYFPPFQDDLYTSPQKIIIPSTSGWVPAVPLGCIALEDFGHTQGRVPDRGVGPDMVGLGMVGLQRWGVFKRFEITHVGQLLHKLCCDLNKCKETRLFFEAWNFVQCLTPSMFIVVFPIETFASANRRFLVGTGPGRQRDDIMRRFFLWPWTYWPWYFPRNIHIYLDRYVLLIIILFLWWSLL